MSSYSKGLAWQLTVRQKKNIKSSNITNVLMIFWSKLCWWWWSGASLCFISSTFSGGPLSKISIWWSHYLFSPTSMTRERWENLWSQVILIRVFLIILQLRRVCTIFFFVFYLFFSGQYLHRYLLCHNKRLIISTFIAWNHNLLLIRPHLVKLRKQKPAGGRSQAWPWNLPLTFSWDIACNL